MCLGDLGQIVELQPGESALVNTGARTTRVSLLTLQDPVALGDWVVCHSGFALSRITPEAAHEAAALRATHAAEPATHATTTEVDS
jgi:hydrogenase expression/formation protein HypC